MLNWVTTMLTNTDTHVTHLDRIERLVSITMLAFV